MLFPELIGEEIYDEFDTQGAHGDPYEVPPILVQDDDGAIVAATATSVSRPPSIKAGHGHALNVHMPTALKGLGFFRPRSAPPIPPPQTSSELEPKLTAGEAKSLRIEDNRKSLDATSSPPIQMPKPVKSTGRGPPSIILEQHSSVSSSDSGVNASLAFPAGVKLKDDTAKLTTDPKTKSTSSPTATSSETVPEGYDTPSSIPGLLVTNAPVVAQSRSASPGPATLEAILLDRKRRLAASQKEVQTQAHPNSPGGSPAPSTSPTPAPQVIPGTNVKDFAHALPGVGPVMGAPVPAPPVGAGVAATAAGPPASGVAPPSLAASRAVSTKGTRFKSSPLGGGDRQSVVVAEKVGAAYSPGTTSPGEAPLSKPKDEI